VPILQLTGDYALNPPDTAEIFVLDREKNEILAFEPLTGDLTDPETFSAITSSDLPILTGLYYFRVELYRQGQLLSTEETPFFIAPEQSQIVSVSTYPSALVAKGYGLLQAKIIPPTSSALSDPYLRWTQDGVVLAQGLLSEGYDTIPVKAPDTPGVFKGNLEIYPFGPRPGELFTFPAPLSRSIEAVVANVPPNNRTDLGPEKDFFTLLHFNGSLDSVGSGPSSTFEPTELLLPGLRGRTFGYEFLADRSLQTNSFLLPQDDQGYLRESTALFSFVLDFLPIEGRITLLSTGVTGWSVEYFVDSSGALGIEVLRGSQSWKVTSRPGIIPEPGREPVTLNLAFSLYPSGEKDLGVLVLVDGIVRAGGLLPDGLLPLTSSGARGQVGGNFSGVLDEFGVYSRTDSSGSYLASGLFAQAMERRYGDRVEYAYSFESGVAEVAHQGLSFSSDPVYRPGVVLLPPGESITFPGVVLESAEIEFYLGVDPNSEWVSTTLELDLTGGSGDKVLKVDMDGRVQILEGSNVLISRLIPVNDPGNLRLILGVTDQGLALSVDRNLVQLPRVDLSSEVVAYIRQEKLAYGASGVQHFAAVQARADFLGIFRDASTPFPNERNN